MNTPSRNLTKHFTIKELDVISEALIHYRDAKEAEHKALKRIKGAPIVRPTFPGSLKLVKSLVREFCDAWLKADRIQKVNKLLAKMTKGKRPFKGVGFPDKPVIPKKTAVFDGKVKMYTGILRGGKSNGIGPSGTDPATW
jgi:hypothetical protein